MIQADSIQFVDVESGQRGLVVVRFDDHSVALAASLLEEGDIEVCLSKDDARKVAEALLRACS